MITLDRSSSVPVQDQLAEQLRFQIASGQYRVSETLPSTRGLARELGIWLLLGSTAVRVDDGDGPEADGRLANRSLLFDDRGRIAARYDKIHMFDVDVPDDFYSLVAARHDDEGTGGGEGGERDERVEGLPDTEKLFYDDQSRTQFEAVVIDVIKREDGYDVVLDQTMFYPEGGGQPGDTGTLSTEDATVEVTDTREVDGVVLHRTDEDPGKGEFVSGQVDAARRRRLMQHHTATHIIGHAAREVLGPHVRQAGAQKGVDSSRLDVTHYDRISREDVKRIERVANGIVTDNVSVKQEWLDRNEAQDRHGFDLFQGYFLARPRIISDNGPQFIAKDFKEFVRVAGLTHVKTSPYYPQSNGKIERWHRSLKSDCVRPGSPTNLDEARRLIGRYTEYYNGERLHSAIGTAPCASSPQSKNTPQQTCLSSKNARPYTKPNAQKTPAAGYKKQPATGPQSPPQP